MNSKILLRTIQYSFVALSIVVGFVFGMCVVFSGLDKISPWILPCLGVGGIIFICWVFALAKEDEIKNGTAAKGNGKLHPCAICKGMVVEPAGFMKAQYYPNHHPPAFWVECPMCCQKTPTFSNGDSAEQFWNDRNAPTEKQ